MLSPQLAPRWDGGLEAFIPTPYKANHAASLVDLWNGDLLAVWFAGSEEGRNDIKIVMSRLKSGETIWSEPIQVSDDYAKSEQNPVLFQSPNGRVYLLYTAQEAREMSRAEYEKQNQKRDYTKQ